MIGRSTYRDETITSLVYLFSRQMPAYNERTGKIQRGLVGD
jgi:hypothetical protein